MRDSEGRHHLAEATGRSEPSQASLLQECHSKCRRSKSHESRGAQGRLPDQRTRTLIQCSNFFCSRRSCGNAVRQTAAHNVSMCHCQPAPHLAPGSARPRPRPAPRRTPPHATSATNPPHHHPHSPPLPPRALWGRPKAGGLAAAAAALHPHRPCSHCPLPLAPGGMLHDPAVGPCRTARRRRRRTAGTETRGRGQCRRALG